MSKRRKKAKKAAQAALAESAPQQGGLLDMLKAGLAKPGVKGAAAGSIGWLAMDALLNAYNQSADRGVQAEAMQGQAEMATPDNLFYQAALPGAQAEEEQARAALLQQLSGGVIGPTLARGERLIGG